MSSSPLTFSEAVNAYQCGTSSYNSSPASKRVSYMTFSNYHRQNKKSSKLFSGQRPAPLSEHASERKFHRLNSVLLKAHFASILSALYEFGLIAGCTHDRLVATIDHPQWDHAAVHSWSKAYARYLKTDDLSFFVSVMNTPIEAYYE